ncbi:hypothetical protein GIB67_014720 [Kingdonia uniflora]|uniref:HMA domain-containing protein n=1 Tax=Kingdonia uniflora TaxID=39325 RepID=A0A7J7NUY0_9MAGN|nr:hypothetical protein GIB67_014720 [Kingdonia uniflora]
MKFTYAVVDEVPFYATLDERIIKIQEDGQKALEALEKVELKVFVHCCDGSKRKVKKLLQGIEGVLKIEIDSSQSKITASGYVDPLLLIRKLVKPGKETKIWNAVKKDKDTDMVTKSRQERTKDDETGYGKYSNSYGTSDKTKEIVNYVDNKGTKKLP